MSEKVPARGDTSLLKFLLALREVQTTDANLNLFSRAGVWSDFTLRRRDTRPGTLARYQIEEVTLWGTYDFRDQPASLMALDFNTANEGVRPVIRVDRTDLTGRRDGIQRFQRIYGWNPSGQVKLTAPEWFGYWKFERWTDCFGNELGRDPTLAVLLDDNKRVQAHYLNTDTDQDSMPDARELAWFGNLAQGTDDDWDGDGLSNFGEMVYGPNPSLQDTDGDGFDDSVEIAANSDPLKSASQPLHLSEVADLGGGSFRLRWSSELGKTYVIEGSARLAAGEPWQHVTELESVAFTSEVILESGDSQHFFRVKTGGVPSVKLPKITLQPDNLMILPGEVASLNVVATGTAPLTYQWYVGPGAAANPVLGATNSAYSSPPLSVTTEYWVRVSNAAGSIDSQTATVTVMVTEPSAREAYVSNQDDDTVSVIDRNARSVEATIPVGDRPMAILASPNGRRVYVANYNSGDISVIDTVIRQVVATVGVGSAPTGVAMSRDGQRVYVANSGSSSISVVDTAMNEVITSVPTSKNPSSLAYHPVRDEIWVGYGALLEARSATDYSVLASVTGVDRYYAPTALAFLPDGSEAFGVEGCGACGRFHRISGVHFGGVLSVLQKNILYDNSGSALSVAIDSLTGTTYLGKQGHMVNPQNPRIYEFGRGRSLGLAFGPRAMAVDPEVGELWVVQDSGVVVVDTGTLSVIGSVNFGSGPQGIVLVNRLAR